MPRALPPEEVTLLALRRQPDLDEETTTAVRLPRRRAAGSEWGLEGTGTELGRPSTLEDPLDRRQEVLQYVEEYAERVEMCRTAEERATLLAELAEIFEHDLDDADTAFSARLKSYAQAPDRAAWPVLDRLAAETGRWAELAECEEAAVRKLEETDQEEAWRRIARCYANPLRDPQRALQVVEAAATVNACGELVALRAELLRRCERWDELARLLASSLEREPTAKRAAIHLELGRLYECRISDLDRASVHYRKALGDDPGGEAATALEALFRRRRQVGELVALLEWKLQLIDVDDGMIVRRELAELYASTLDDAETAALHRELIRARWPRDVENLRALERCYQVTGQSSSQAQVLLALVEQTDEPEAEVELYRRAASACEQAGEIERAAECLEWALTRDPRDAELFVELERLYAGAGLWPAAVDAYARHAELAESSERVQLLVRAARICEERLEDPSTAVDFYRKALGIAEDLEVLIGLSRACALVGDHDSQVAALEQLAERAESAHDRADILYRMAEVLGDGMGDDEAALAMLEQAVSASPGHCAATLAFARLLSERGELTCALEQIERCLCFTGPYSDHAKLHTEAGNLHVRQLRVDAAVGEYRRALELDQDHAPAARALSDLLWSEGRIDELLSVQELCVRHAATPAGRVNALMRLGWASRTAGELRRAEAAFARAANLCVTGEARFEQAKTRVQQGRFAEALALLEELRQRDGEHHARAEFPYLIARCQAQVEQPSRAFAFLAAALELDPQHRPALLLQAELCRHDARAFVRAKRALVATVTAVDDRVALLMEIAEVTRRDLNDPEEALALYSQALEVAPNRRSLLFRCFEVGVELERWEESLGLLDRLLLIEPDPEVRARYHRTAAAICRDELGATEAALAHLTAAVTETRSWDDCAEELEAMLIAEERWGALCDAYAAVIAGLDPDDDADRRVLVELWTKVGELCLERLDGDTGLSALEVAASLDERDAGWRERMSALYIEAGPDYIDKAIGHQEALLDLDREQVEPYYVLAELYSRSGREGRASACRAAARVLATHGVGVVPPDSADGEESAVTRVSARSVGDVLSADLWERLRGGPFPEPRVSALLTAVAPALASARAERRRGDGRGAENQLDTRARHPFLRAFENVTTALGVPVPDLYANHRQRRSFAFRHGIVDREVVLALSLGRPILHSGRTVADLERAFAGPLSRLRRSSWVRLLVDNPGQLAHLLQAGIALSGRGERAGAESRSVLRTRRVLEQHLCPIGLDHVSELGAELGEAGIDCAAQAERWWRLVERTELCCTLLFVSSLEKYVGRVVEECRRRPGLGAVRRRVARICRYSVSDAVLSAREQIGRGW